ncbi:MAG: hypothetical protein ACOYT8_00160 [Candidatus Dependentiae bacterium]
MLKKLLLISFICSLSLIAQTHEKFVIGQHGCGFFSSFFGALNNLIWCEQNNKVPVIYWDKSSLYFDERDVECKNNANAWPCFFKPVSEQNYENGDYVHNSYFDKDGHNLIAIPPCSHQRAEINELINKWIYVNESILKVVDDYYEQHIKGKKTIGIHIRRTDKNSERPHVPLQTIFDCTNRYDADQYFVATDEEEILQAAKTALNKPVISFAAGRSTNGFPIHYNPEQSNRTQAGREVLIEVLILARTDFFIHTISNVSTAVIYFNPKLPHKELF